MDNRYVHGYDQRENIRLQDQASTLVDLLHSDTSFPAESKVLEAGCGVGSQTVSLARNSPNAHITSIDISEASIDETKRKEYKLDIKGMREMNAQFSVHSGTDMEIKAAEKQANEFIGCFKRKRDKVHVSH